MTNSSQFGNYRVIRLLGQGDFAAVYLGEHIYLKTQAAIKVLQMHLRNDDQQDFLKKAQIIAHLIHPNIIRVLEYGVEGNTPFLVMNYTPNGNLRQQYPIGTQLPVEAVVAYVKQAVAALQYAHEQKLIHGNIKPGNMLLGHNNEVLLSDFGLALVTRSSHSQSLQAVLDTVAYMAPEQIRGKPCSASDQYALGVVVYEWLCGCRPFNGSDYVELANQHLLISPPPLRDKVPTISAAIEEVVLKALAKDPQPRFESIQAFAHTLEEAYVRELPLPAIPTRPLSTTLSSASISQPATAPKPHLSRRTLLAGLAGLTVVGGGVGWLTHQLRSQAPIQPAPPVTIHHPRGTILQTYRGHSDRVYAVAWSADGRRIASWSDDQTMKVWDAATGHTLVTRAMLDVLGYSRDWHYIASFGGVQTKSIMIQVWDINTGHIIVTHRFVIYPLHDLPINAALWSPDNTRIASATGNGLVQVWRGADTILEAPGGLNGALTWSPDSKRIAFVNPGQGVEIWNITPKKHIYTYHGHVNNPFALAWSPNGRYIASSENKMVQVWDAISGKHILTYDTRSAIPNDRIDTIFLAWSPDSKYIASFDYLDYYDRDLQSRQTMQIWDAISGKQIYIFPRGSSQLNALAWSPDGTRIVSAYADGTVQVWQTM